MLLDLESLPPLPFLYLPYIVVIIMSYWPDDDYGENAEGQSYINSNHTSDRHGYYWNNDNRNQMVINIVY